MPISELPLLAGSASWFAKIDRPLSVGKQTVRYWNPMTDLGRYVKLNIAATMCRTELCEVAPPHRGLALVRRGIGSTVSTHSYSA